MSRWHRLDRYFSICALVIYITFCTCDSLSAFAALATVGLPVITNRFSALLFSMPSIIVGSVFALPAAVYLTVKFFQARRATAKGFPLDVRQSNRRCG